MILTVDEFREHVETTLGDDAVQRLLDGAEALIVARVGPVGFTTELVGGGRRFITLSRPIGTLGSIKERYADDDELTLAADDYLVFPGGTIIERRSGGTNSRSAFAAAHVLVTYTPADDEALRILVQLGLVKLEIAFEPALASTTIGSWTEQYHQGRSKEDQVEDLLSLLEPRGSMVVVG